MVKIQKITAQPYLLENRKPSPWYTLPIQPGNAYSVYIKAQSSAFQKVPCTPGFAVDWEDGPIEVSHLEASGLTKCIKRNKTVMSNAGETEHRLTHSFPRFTPCMVHSFADRHMLHHLRSQPTGSLGLAFHSYTQPPFLHKLHEIVFVFVLWLVRCLALIESRQKATLCEPVSLVRSVFHRLLAKAW